MRASVGIDLERIRRAPWDPAAGVPLRDSLNLLFVGSICEGHRQLALVDLLHEFMRAFASLALLAPRLILAGATTEPAYRQRIEERIRALGLEGHVLLAGKVPEATLFAWYRNADAFVCMSAREDACTPLIESMVFDLPVVAHAAGSVPAVLGGGGLLSPDGAPRAMAALLHQLLTEPALRRRAIAAQRRNLRRFERSPPSGLAPYWQIEGPFDSSYSLAIVNRELGRALARRGNDVGLRSREGSGEFAPSAAFLAANPDCAALALRAAETFAAPDVALRFCYPPYLDNMTGSIRAVHSYGWEETGFPTEYVAAFNRKLDLITVLSSQVEKILRDNGIRIPIAVTGGGVDHLLGVTAVPPDAELRAFRFLHISSCFPRKGVDALLWAYGQAFRDRDDVSLVLKTFANPHNDTAFQVRHFRERDPGYPHVHLIERDMDQTELVGLYAACHAFVAPSRGEGLGLPLAEAMLFDLPVITTAWGGQRDFCDDSTAWLCDYQFSKSRTHFGLAHSVWADPDVDHLAALLREVHQLTPEQRSSRTDAARRRVLRDFTWDRVAARTEQAIAALAAQPELRHEPRIGWLSTWNKRCGIAAYSSFLTVAIPPDRLTILADRTAERTAADGENVLRGWNMRHDETLDDVYAEVIARGIGALVIQYNFGFYSLSALARLIDRLTSADVGVHCFFHATGDFIWKGLPVSLGEIAGALALADRLYVHTVQDLNRFKKHGLVDNVVFFPQGVLPTPAPADGAKRHALGLQGKRVIAAYGYLLPHKGTRQIIQVFAQLAQEDPSLHLLLVNALYPIPESAQEMAACADLIDASGLSRRVTLLTDYLPEAECLALLQLADLIVFPYQRTLESSSAAVRMGLASGRPVAVTPLSIFDDVADAVHTLSGIDVAAMTADIRALLGDPGEIARQAAQTERWLASRQWPLLSARLLNLIDGIANPLPISAGQTTP